MVRGNCSRLAAALLGTLLAIAGSEAAYRPALAAAAPTQPTLVSIGGGSPDSPAFRTSSALAEILSRPPGLPACDPGALCGVPGVIASAQTYDQPDILLKAIDEGHVTTGVLSALQLYQARCAPPKGRSAPEIRALRGLYREPLQLVLPADSSIRTPKDLAGKPVAIGERGSDAELAAMGLLDAYGIPRAKTKLQRLSPTQALDALKSRTVQAAILLGHANDGLLADLVGQGGYTLLSLPDSPERRRFLHTMPAFEADALPPAAYPTLGATSTVAERVMWVAGPALAAPDLGQKLVAAAMEARNLTRLSQLVEPLSLLPQGEAFVRLPAPLAEGAARVAAAANLPVDEIACPGAHAP